MLLTDPVSSNQIGIDRPFHFIQTFPDPEVRLVDGLLSEEMSQHYYFTEDADLRAEVAGKSSGTYHLTKMKNNQLVHVVVPTASGLKDTINLNDDALTAFSITLDDDASRAGQTYTVEVDSADDEQVTQFASNDLPIMPGATIRFVLEDNSTLILIDYDNDGTYDYNTSADGSIEEPHAPLTEALIFGTQNPDQTYKRGAFVRLIAQDNSNGIGVRQTEYSIDGGSTWSDYDDNTPPVFNTEGTVALLYHSVDAFGNAEDNETRTFTITPNRAPELTAIEDRSVDEGQTLTFTVTATDPDTGDTLTFSATNLPTGASFDSETHVFSWTPDFTAASSYPGIVFTVTDNGTPAHDDSETIGITVNEADDP